MHVGVKTTGAMAGLGLLVVLFWVWKIWLPRHQFQDFDADSKETDCSKEGSYTKAYLTYYDKTGGCEEADAMMNSLILAATLVALYWMIQHAKHDWGLHSYGLGIRYDLPLIGNFGNSKWFSAIMYAILMAAVIANTLVVLPISKGAAAGVYVVLMAIWFKCKDARRYPNLRTQGKKKENGGVGAKAYVRALTLDEKIHRYTEAEGEYESYESYMDKFTEVVEAQKLLKAAKETVKEAAEAGKEGAKATLKVQQDLTTEKIQTAMKNAAHIREAMLFRHELLTATPGRQHMWKKRQGTLEKLPDWWVFSPKNWIIATKNLGQRFKFVWGDKFFNVRLPSAINPRLFLGWVLLLCCVGFIAYKRTVMAGILGGLVAVVSLVLLGNTYKYRSDLKASMNNNYTDKLTRRFWRGRRLYYKATAKNAANMHTYRTYMKAQMNGETTAPNVLDLGEGAEVLVPLAELDALVSSSDGCMKFEGVEFSSLTTLNNLVSETPKEGMPWMWRWDVLQKIGRLSKAIPPKAPEAEKLEAEKLKDLVQHAYKHVSWEWWNGAWVNFWRLFLVSSTFHFVAIMLTASSVKAAPTYCTDTTGVPDQCAFYTMLERYNLLGSLVLTLLLFSLFMAGGVMQNKVGGWCQLIIGTEDVKADGEWWQVMSDNNTIRALLLYIAVFAGIAHGGAVGYVQTQQMTNLRDSAVHQSYADNPTVTGNATEAEKEKAQKDEGRKSIVEYAMENDIASNAIMILLLVYLVPYVNTHIWEPAKANAAKAAKA